MAEATVEAATYSCCCYYRPVVIVIAIGTVGGGRGAAIFETKVV